MSLSIGCVSQSKLELEVWFELTVTCSDAAKKVSIPLTVTQSAWCSKSKQGEWFSWKAQPEIPKIYSESVTPD